VISSFLALPSVALALLLAPDARVSTYRALEVALACEASCRGTLVRPDECVALAYVETRFRPERVSAKGCIGVVQVSVCNLLVAGRRVNAPAAGPWDVHCIAGGIDAGVLAADALKRAHGALWPRFYGCGTKAARRGDRACVQHEMRVYRAMKRLASTAPVS
jgi:hypothetical protein